MSRGHGRIQLQVLDFLLRHDEAALARGDNAAYVSIVDIAGAEASRSRIESVRRAMKSLADEGLLRVWSEESPRPTARDRRLSSVSQSNGLMVRLATHADERREPVEGDAKSEMSA